MTDAPSTHYFHRSKHNFLSYSQLADFMACNYRWSLRYFRGWHPKTDARPMALGSAVHECIEHYLKDGTSPFATILDWKDAQVEQQGGESEDLFEIVFTAPRLAERALKEIEALGWRPVKVNGEPSVEMDLLVPLAGFDGFICHIDFLAYDPSSKLFRIVDFKVRSTFSPEDSEMTNLQLAIYQYMCLKHGIHVAGTVAFEIRNKLPSEPKLNKNGSMSRTAIQTDWETYEAALIENDLDPADYEDMKGKLSDYKFIQHIHAYRGEEELQRIWDTIVVPVSRQIVKEREALRANVEYEPIRHMKTFHCRSCQFKDVCIQGLAGYDFAPVLDTLFEQAK